MGDTDLYTTLQKAKESLEALSGQRKWFTPQVTLGNLLSAISMLCAVIGIWHAMDVRLSVLETRMNFQEKVILQVGDNQARLLETQARLTALIEKGAKP